MDKKIFTILCLHIFIHFSSEKTDNYSYTIPVLKALIEKAEPLLTLDLNLPNLPSTSLSPTFFDDFKTYCLDEEWTMFIDNYVSVALVTITSGSAVAQW